MGRRLRLERNNVRLEIDANERRRAETDSLYFSLYLLVAAGLMLAFCLAISWERPIECCNDDPPRRFII
jgi:hypothetical protein